LTFSTWSFLAPPELILGVLDRFRGPPESTPSLQKLSFYLGGSTILKKTCFCLTKNWCWKNIKNIIKTDQITSSTTFYTSPWYYYWDPNVPCFQFFKIKSSSSDISSSFWTSDLALSNSYSWRESDMASRNLQPEREF